VHSRAPTVRSKDEPVNQVAATTVWSILKAAGIDPTH
jgi:hypothetical protein